LKRYPTRRLYLVTLAILLCVLAVAAWWLLGRGGARQDRAWQRVQAEGRIQVGIDPSYPPFEYTNEQTGGIEGYDVDLAREIGRRLGLEVDFVLIGFDSLYDAVRSAKVDAVISGMPYDPNWTEDVSYGIWYFNAGQFLVVRPDDDRIKSIDDLTHHRLGVELGTTGDLEARRLQRQVDDVNLVTYPTAESTLNALAAQEIDAALVDAISAYLFIAKGGQATLLDKAVSDESYAAVTDRKSAQLRTAIDTVILEMKQDGFLDSLRDKWLLRKS
jgi:ABC-type amino acid transport substrate-binding protein